MAMILAVKDGNFYYSKGKIKEKTSFLYHDPINFELKPGEILSILGPNGAGKTTMLKCIMGLQPWKQGASYLDGKPMNSLSQKFIWQQIGYIPQASKMTFAYSILDLVIMGRAIYIGAFSKPSDNDRKLAFEALESVGISHLAEQSCNSVSGGELQLALIARTLVSDPKILVLDEPESHLDIHKQKIILETIQKLVREKNISCIINTHYANHAIYFGDKVLLVAKNKPVITGNVNELLNEKNMLTYFGIKVKKLQMTNQNLTFSVLVPEYFGMEKI